MDSRNGNLYSTHVDALTAGVPPEHIEMVNTRTITSGPFKGRTYVVNPDGRLGRRVQRPTDAGAAE